MNSNRKIFKVFVLVIEFIIINLSCKFAYFLRFKEYSEPSDAYVLFFVFFTLAWILASLFTNAYEQKKLLNLNVFLQSFGATLFIQVFIVTVFIVSVKMHILSREYLLYTYVSSSVAIFAFRSILLLAYRYYNSMTYTIRKMALVGSDAGIEELNDHFESKNTTIFRFLHNIDPSLSEFDKNILIREEIDALKTFCKEEGVNEIYMALNLLNDDLIEELSDFAENNFVYFRMVTDFKKLGPRPVNVDFFGHTPILSLRKEPLATVFNQTMKRAFDVTFSLLVIIFVFPVLIPIVGLLIKLETEGPIFFKQLRTGKNGRDFMCIKFRTMGVNKESDSLQVTKGDKRITRIGAILRKTSLDEFPQFINVLRGDMSVVGPRPHMLKHTDEYSQIINKYLFRHFITPGITGYAQVNGYRGETTDPEMMRKRVEHDAWYVENWSLFLDVKIIFLTVWNAVRGEENAY